MVDSEFCFIGLNQTLLSAEINGSIVGLLAASLMMGTSMRSSVLPKHSRRDRPIAGGIHRRRRPTAQRQSGHDGLLTSL